MLLENDVIFAYLNEYDPKHKTVARIFDMLRAGRLGLQISSVALLEMELIYRSEKVEDRLLRDLAALAALPNVEYVPLTADIAVTATYLRQNKQLSFFDSHYAATSLSLDGKILSYDLAYERIEGIKRIRPESMG